MKKTILFALLFLTYSISAHAFMDGAWDKRAAAEQTWSETTDNETTGGLVLGDDITVQGVSYFGDKVGIGTASPTVDGLQVVQSAVTGADYNADDVASFERNGHSYVNIISTNSTIGGLTFSDDFTRKGRLEYSHSGDIMTLYTGGFPRVYLNSSGFGIGTSSPTAQLEIEGTNSPRDLLGVNSLTTDDVLVVKENGDMAVNTDDLYVDISTGYVGIGTATPLANLHMVGGQPRFEKPSSAGFLIGNTGQADPAGRFAWLAFSDSLVLGDFSAANYVGFTKRFTLDGGGNVGINTATPDAQLTVIGDINISNNLSTSGASNDTAPTGTSKYIEVYINGVLYEIEAKLPS